MKTVIIDYNAGNIRSVENACRRLDVEPVITADPQLIREADKVIFPGVGEAATTMSFLREHGLDQVICSLKQPVLGICLGMQLMCRHSEEGDTECLGIFDAEVKRFVNQRHEDKVPHMGWNTLYNLKSTLLAGVPENAYVYSFTATMCLWAVIRQQLPIIFSPSVLQCSKIISMPLSSIPRRVERLANKF